ncbi:MAG: hypothetical protein WA414_19310 [Acidobacteriaceae bacterium]
MPERRPELDDLPHAYHGHDPVQAAERQTNTINRAWLKDGESLTLLQRSGFAILSLLSVACGIYVFKACVLEWMGGDWIFVLIFGAATLFFFYVGIGGLRNVLRFPTNQA